MVNYLYDLSRIEENHEAFANQNEIVASSAVRKMLKTGARVRLAPAPLKTMPLENKAI
jgi:malonyl-CoA decarboxylase